MAEPVSNPDEILVAIPAMPEFSVRVAGTRSALSILVVAGYSLEHRFPALSDQPRLRVYLKDPDDPLVRRVRNLPAEQNAVKLVRKWGFEPAYTEGDQKLYLTDPGKVLDFLASGLPYLRRHGVKCTLAPALQALYDRMGFLVPVVKIRDVPGQDAFDACCLIDGGPDNRLGRADIQSAMGRGDSFILKDGQVTLFDRSAIDEMRAVFRDTVSRRGGSPRGWFRMDLIHAGFVRSALDAICDSVDLEADEAPRWQLVSSRLNRQGAKLPGADLGPLSGTLRPYQREGVAWMEYLAQSGFCGLLADEMGLGKTLQTLAWIALTRRQGRQGPCLVVCPTSLVPNWEAEAKKFVPELKTLAVSGPGRDDHFHEIPQADLVITSYALLQRDFPDAYLGVQFDVMVLDEAQHIKNRNTNNARFAKEVECRRRLVLTGTPIENSVSDVWSIFDFLMPGYLGDYESFKLAYEDPIQDGGEEGRLAQERLKRKLHPFILRRLKRDVAKDLPDKLVRVLECPMPDQVRREYLAVKRSERSKAVTKFQLLALLMKLRQIASSGKVEALLEQLSEAIDGGHRVLVFSQFVTQLERLKSALDEAGIRYCYLDGSTRNRLEECNRFNRERDIPVFLISLMAGGTGLNLTGADMVIHYDPWWNPAVEDQATDRAHRIGQTRRVYVTKLIAHDSVEEKVLALQRKKQAVIAATVSAGDAAIADRLSLADLSHLLD